MYMYIHAHGKIGNRGRKELEERREGGRGEKRIKRTKRIETKYMDATMYSTCTCTYNNNNYYYYLLPDKLKRSIDTQWIPDQLRVH